MKTHYPMIPFPLIVKATDGDTEAINQILPLQRVHNEAFPTCLLYTSDAADEEDSVDLGGCRTVKKKKNKTQKKKKHNPNQKEELMGR